MQTSPILSIILPVYNGVSFLGRAIDSVVQQKGIPFELILINDGSTDGTDDLCQSCCKEYPWIRYVKQENLGLSTARNTGLRHAVGKYIAFLDADDYVEADYYSCLVSVAVERASDFIVTGFERDFVRDDRLIHTRSVHFDDLYLSSPEQIRKYCEETFFYNIYIHVWNKLYRRDFLTRFHIRFEESARFGEDVFFNLEVLRHSKSVCFSKRSGYHYICRQSNRLTTAWREDLVDYNRMIYDRIAAYERQYWNCDDSPIASGMYLRGCFLAAEKALQYGLTGRERHRLIESILNAEETKKSTNSLRSKNISLEFKIYRFVVSSHSANFFLLAVQARRWLKRFLGR